LPVKYNCPEITPLLLIPPAVALFAPVYTMLAKVLSTLDQITHGRVICTLGSGSVPAAFNSAARIILANLWDTQHGPTARPSLGGVDMVTPPGFGFAIPNRAMQLLEGGQDGMPFLSEAFV
jgi:hypothetical protein